MPTGIVKKWFDDKGFGFITPDNGGEDAFIHRSNLDGAEALTEGDAVRFETEWDDRKGKMKCSTCSLVGGGSGGGYGGYGGGGRDGGYSGGYGGGKGKGKGKSYDPY